MNAIQDLQNVEDDEDVDNLLSPHYIDAGLYLVKRNANVLDISPETVLDSPPGLSTDDGASFAVVVCRAA